MTQGPANTYSASSKLRPCLATFVRFFASSHSYFIPSHLKPIVLLFVVTGKLSRKLVVANHLIDSITDRFFCLPAIATWDVLATTILVPARAVFPLMSTS